MNEHRMLRLLWLGAFAVLALGAGMAIRTSGRLRGDAARIRRKAEELESLRMEKAMLEDYTVAVRAIDALPATARESFAGILKSATGTAQPEDVRDLYEPCAPGWTLHVKELVFDDLAIEEAMRLVGELEAQRPPWRMAKCGIRASSQEAGRGRVMLRMEHLEKQEGSPRSP